jgi:hypothetical protein
MEPKARQVYGRYLDELDDADVRELAIHRRVSRLNYSRRCAEASAVRAHIKQGLFLAPGMVIGYVIRDAKKWEVDPGEDGLRVRCFILSRAAGEGLGRSGVCVHENHPADRLILVIPSHLDNFCIFWV